MCDYSLMTFPNRLAREGEELQVHRFPSGSLGLASPVEIHPGTGPKPSFWAAVRDFFNPVGACSVPAVCIPPGARLQFHEIGDRFQKQYQVQAEEEVTFEQLSASVNSYRDAVAFSNGRKVRLQELPEGQRVTVLSLGEHEYELPEVREFEALSRRA